MSAPFFENFFKMERPIPLFAPVISANLFFSISLLPKLYFITSLFYISQKIFLLYFLKSNNNNFFAIFFAV